MPNKAHENIYMLKSAKIGMMEARIKARSQARAKKWATLGLGSMPKELLSPSNRQQPVTVRTHIKKNVKQGGTMTTAPSARSPIEIERTLQRRAEAKYRQECRAAKLQKLKMQQNSALREIWTEKNNRLEQLKKQKKQTQEERRLKREMRAAAVLRRAKIVKAKKEIDRRVPVLDKMERAKVREQELQQQHLMRTAIQKERARKKWIKQARQKEQEAQSYTSPGVGDYNIARDGFTADGGVPFQCKTDTTFESIVKKASELPGPGDYDTARSCFPKRSSSSPSRLIDTIRKTCDTVKLVNMFKTSSHRSQKKKMPESKVFSPIRSKKRSQPKSTRLARLPDAERWALRTGK